MTIGVARLARLLGANSVDRRDGFEIRTERSMVPLQAEIAPELDVRGNHESDNQTDKDRDQPQLRRQ
jgi:hypothetical protein